MGDDKEAYQGVERRQEPRRVKRERREMLRWEPNKSERRQGKGRRKEDIDMWRPRNI